MPTDLFGETPVSTPLGPKLGPKGGKHYTRPKGYAAAPGSGPKGKTCRDCAHAVRYSHNSRRRWPKCELAAQKWTSGRGSDILLGAAACRLFKEKT